MEDRTKLSPCLFVSNRVLNTLPDVTEVSVIVKILHTGGPRPLSNLTPEHP